MNKYNQTWYFGLQFKYFGTSANFEGTSYAPGPGLSLVTLKIYLFF